MEGLGKNLLDVAGSDCLLLHEQAQREEVEVYLLAVVAHVLVDLPEEVEVLVVDLLEVRPFVSNIETFCLAYLAE